MRRLSQPVLMRIGETNGKESMMEAELWNRRVSAIFVVAGLLLTCLSTSAVESTVGIDGTVVDICSGEAVAGGVVSVGVLNLPGTTDN